MESIIVENLSKEFNIGFKKNQLAFARIFSLLSGREPKRKIKVLNNLSFSCKQGEVIGLIGKNGSGKSTLLRILAGIYENYDGSFSTKGRVIPLIDLGFGAAMRLSLRDNIFLMGSIFGITRKEIKRKFNSILDFAELNDFAETKLYQFSSGMRERFFFSLAIHCNPKILLLDEVFAVGDEKFRQKSTNKINELIKNGCTIVLVSHEIQIIKTFCNRVFWLDKGKIKKEGPTLEIIDEYLND